MSWFRSHLHLGSWCALLALTVQLVLSFGHVHLSGLRLPSATAATVQLSSDQPLQAKSDAPAVPAKKQGLGADYCAICAFGKLAWFDAEAPALPLPVATGPQCRSVLADAAPPACSQLLFQARAPPAA